MKKLITLFAAVAIITSAFTKSPKFDFVGTYGVSKNDPAQIKLVINQDHSFTYQDFSVPNKINVSGSWELKGNTVVLKSSSNTSFHNKWNFTKDGMKAKSRKGMCFYILGKLE